jgi:predicted alpha-1,2-mannosidase
MLAAFLVSCLLALTAIVAPAEAASEDFTPFVKPFVGTASGARDFGTGGGAGNTFPGAVVPFGMVQFSPDTSPGSDNFAGGYSYGERRIKGFGLTHFSGAGCGLLQDLPITPTVARVDRSPALPGSAALRPRYVAAYSHSREHASPGDYRVSLDPGTRRSIGVELTATTRTGLARLVFPRTPRASVLFNVAGSKRPSHETRVWLDPRRRQVSGMAESGRFCGRVNSYRVWFVAQFKRGFRTFGTWRRGSLQRHGRRVTDEGRHARAGGYVTFDTRRRQGVDVRIGVSFTSLAGARRNLRAESARGAFGLYRRRARAAWAGALRHIAVSGGAREDLGVFYTALYHSLLHPNVVSDADGSFLGLDGRVHRLRAGRERYANYSGWDVYRGQQQLVAMLFPRRASDMAESLVGAARESDCLPRWSLVSGHTGVMVGDPSDNVLASAYAFGARRFDARGALAAMLRGARGVCHSDNGNYTEREGLADYLRQGYVGEEHDVKAPEPGAAERVWGPAATTLEYAVADFSVSRLATALGRPAAAREMLRRSANWRHVFDGDAGFVVPRFSSGSWLAPFSPRARRGFVEGDAAQYTWFVPHDPAGLFIALGGMDRAAARLDAFFTRLNDGPRSRYAFLGNEPSLGVPWLYDWLGRPFRTQGIVRQAILSLWSLSPGGMPGNDDGGTMSAWWVFGALGMYPAVPGDDVLALGSPLFRHARLATARGLVVIDAPGAGRGAPFVQSATLGGQAWDRPWVRFSDLRRAGRLSFVLSSRPAPSWGSDPAMAPPSFEP